MFKNFKALAGSLLQKIDSSLNPAKEGPGPKPVLFDEDEDVLQIQVQTVRPLFEKKTSRPVDAEAPKPNPSLSQSMFVFPSNSFEDRPAPAAKPKKQQASVYKKIETPRNIWDKRDLEDILSFDDLELGFDESFRAELEASLAVRQKPPEELCLQRMGEFAQKCEFLQILKCTIDNHLSLEPVAANDGDLATAQGFHLHLLACPAEHYLAVVFNELVFPAARQAPDSDDSDQENSSSNSGTSARSGTGHLDRFVRRFVCKRDKVLTVLDDLNRKRVEVDTRIASIVNKRNCDFWGTCQEFVRLDSEYEGLDEKVADLRRKLAVCKSASVDQYRRVKSLIDRKDRVQRSLLILQTAKEKFRKIIKFCKFDLINAELEELPDIYEGLLLSYFGVLQGSEDFRSLGCLPRRVTEMILFRLEVIKKRLKGLLYNHLNVYNLEQDRPPSKELISLFMIYNLISDKFREAQEDHPEESQQFAEDSILLKSHCFQLLHMDDTLTCVHSNIITDFF